MSPNFSMKLLQELYESDLGIELKKNSGLVEIRNAVRAVVFDGEGRVGIVYVTNGNYWKIPGGGVEQGESFIQALERELMEEAGVSVVVEKEIGAIIERRDQWEQLQISYCFLARVFGGKQNPKFDEKERVEGFLLQWMPYKEALQKFQENVSITYESKFMQMRDKIFLESVKQDILR